MTPLHPDPIMNQGWFAVRKVRGGAPLPARLWREEPRDDDGALIGDVRYFAEIDGAPVDPFLPPGWPTSWRAVSEEEFAYLTDLVAWSRRHDRRGPYANPGRPAKEAERTFF